MSGTDVDALGWQNFGDSLGEGFEMTTPDGDSIARSDLLVSFEQARNALPGVKIEIRNSKELLRSPTMAVVRYEEWQLHPTGANQRVSTVVLQAAAQAPGSWLWVALHETRLEPGSSTTESR